MSPFYIFTQFAKQKITQSPLFVYIYIYMCVFLFIYFLFIYLAFLYNYSICLSFRLRLNGWYLLDWLFCDQTSDLYYPEKVCWIRLDARQNDRKHIRVHARKTVKQIVRIHTGHTSGWHARNYVRKECQGGDHRKQLWGKHSDPCIDPSFTFIHSDPQPVENQIQL